jgi:RNA polymerase sigma-70 factor (ECF subfamily)
MAYIEPSPEDTSGILALPWNVDVNRAVAGQAPAGGARALDYGTTSDERLVAELARRDVRALEALYDRYGDIVYSVSLRVVGDVQLAEDIAQDVFFRLWSRPELFDAGRGRFMTWLLSIARNRAIDERRSRGRRFRHEALPGGDAEGMLADKEVDLPGESALLADDRLAIQKAMASLPSEQRLAIELAYFGGYTQQEIARGLGQPLGTVKTRIRLGLQKLRILLMEYAKHSREV